MLNLRLMKHWQNWATILLMLLIASFAVNAVSRLIFTDGENK